jgi:hypothetical protein
MSDPKKRAEEIRKSRAKMESDSPEQVVGGLPGWSYYVTQPGVTPPRVVDALRRGGWEEAGADHAGVQHKSTAGLLPGTFVLWAKPTELVLEDLQAEARSRPHGRPLTAAFGV